MYEGKLSIYSDHQRTITIEAEDRKSGTRFLYLEITMHDFMLALTGRADLPCHFELSPDHVGKQRQTKMEEVPFSQGKQSQADAAKPFEVDGWKAYYSDIGNHHNLVRYENGGAIYRVTFTRFVEDE